MTNPETVEVSRRLAAPPQQVFQAWVSGEVLRQWLAPNADADPRTGGTFRLQVSAPDGAHVVTGTYEEFLPPERLAMTWVYQGPMAPEGPMQSRVTVAFAPSGEQTDLALKHEHLTSPKYRDAISGGAWVKALDGLEKVLAVGVPPSTAPESPR